MGKSLKLPEMQFHEKKIDFTSFFAGTFFLIFWLTTQHSIHTLQDFPKKLIEVGRPKKS